MSLVHTYVSISKFRSQHHIHDQHAYIYACASYKHEMTPDLHIMITLLINVIHQVGSQPTGYIAAIPETTPPMLSTPQARQRQLRNNVKTESIVPRRVSDVL